MATESGENPIPAEAIEDPMSVVGHKDVALPAPSAPLVAEKEAGPEKSKPTPGSFIRDIVHGGWSAREITDPETKIQAHHTINALASLDQMKKTIPNPDHPEQQIDNPLYKDGAFYNHNAGEYQCVGRGDKVINGIADLETTAATLGAIAESTNPAIDATKKEAARTLLKEIQEQITAKMAPARGPKPETPAAGPVKKEIASDEVAALVGEGIGIDKARESEFQELWEGFNSGKIKGEELVKRAKEMTNNPAGKAEIALEKAKRILAAKKLYHLFFPTRPIPQTENPDELLDDVLESMGNPTTADAIKKNLGGVLDLLKGGGHGQLILQIFLVIGSAMTSFASTAEEAAK